MAAPASSPRSDASPLSGRESERRATQTLTSAPSALSKYPRAIAPLLPGASRLPWVPGRGGAVPERELALADVRAEPAHLARYARVCGFRLSSTLPPTYPHVLAFGLHMDLMTRGDFPFAPVGLVHIENTITQRKAIPTSARLELRASATQPEPHPKGRTFAFLTEARVDGELVWEERSTMLRRGSDGTDVHKRPSRSAPAELPARAQWTLPGDLGRRYAAVSGDRNPIHLTGLTAKLFGFPDAIAHGMWTAARSLAALEGRLPEAVRADVCFRQPVRLPGRVAFASQERPSGIRFALRDAKRGTLHLEGSTTSLKRGAR